jgi:hypothetical protein
MCSKEGCVLLIITRGPALSVLRHPGFLYLHVAALLNRLWWVWLPKILRLVPYLCCLSRVVVALG